jgi:uncharacterized tellurite resistance protein B-like protein
VNEELEAVPREDDRDEDYDERFLVAALLVFVARGDGAISERETEKMLALVGEHFDLPSGASLALLTRAIEALSDDPQLPDRLRELASMLGAAAKEDVAVMLLNVVAADGRKDAAEMDLLQQAGEIMGITSEGMHRAFDRYFSETWT